MFMCIAMGVSCCKTSWYPTLKYLTSSVVHTFLENLNSKMVVTPSQLRVWGGYGQ